MWKENWPKNRQEDMYAEEEPSTTEEENPSKKRSLEPSVMLPAKKKRKAVEFSNIAWGEEVMPVREEKLEFLRSAPDSNTPNTARQTTIVTLQGEDLAVAKLVNFVLRGVVEVGEANANDRLVELEIVGALAAMVDEEIWSGSVTKAARKAERKAEQELWHALESLDLREPGRLPRRLPRRRRKGRQSPR